MARKFALVIGNSRYDDTHLGRLKAPDVDVQALASVLESPDIGQFDEVVTLQNEGFAAVRKAVARFYDKRQRHDLLFFYFSGHGVKDEQGHLHLALRDTEVSLLAGTALETAFISARMDRSFSTRQVVVLDCCHSGAFARGTKSSELSSVGTAGAFEGTGLGRVILSATDATQYAWEGDQVIGEIQSSLFTHFLIDGLKSGAADLDADGIVTVDELYNYVREQVVTANPRQTPLKWTYSQHGDIVLAQNPFAARSALPATLAALVSNGSSSVRLDAIRELDALVHGDDMQLSRAALAALRELSRDDSRKVAQAAIDALKAHEDRRASHAESPLIAAGHDRRRTGHPTPESTDDRQDIRPSDVFISYAHEDREKAKALAGVFGAYGWRVWWDRKIAPGESFDTVIENELRTCKCAIVLWSVHSVDARWVRNEARRAKKRQVLVPVFIDAVEPPLEFEDLNAADLTSWEAPANHPELETLLARVGALAPVPPDRLAHTAIGAGWNEFAPADYRLTVAGLPPFRPLDSVVAAAAEGADADAQRINSARTEATRTSITSQADEDERARQAVSAARKTFAAGYRKEAVSDLSTFRPTHPAVTSALSELSAEATRIDLERAKTTHREWKEARKRQGNAAARRNVLRLPWPPALYLAAAATIVALAGVLWWSPTTGSTPRGGGSKAPIQTAPRVETNPPTQGANTEGATGRELAPTSPGPKSDSTKPVRRRAAPNPTGANNVASSATPSADAERFFTEVAGKWTWQEEKPVTGRKGGNTRELTQEELRISANCTGVLTRTKTTTSQGFAGRKIEVGRPEQFEFSCGQLKGDLKREGNSLVFEGRPFQRQ